MTQTERPNILFISMDDMNEWFGYLGVNPDVKTPNVDRLAAEGMAFSNAVCASPVCNPSRTAFLTGMRPTTSGCYMLNDNLENSPKRETGIPFPLYFRHNGYLTLTAGKVDHGGQPIERSTQKTFGESMWEEDGGWWDGQQFGLRSPYRDCPTDHPGFYNFAFHWGPLDDELEETLSDVKTAKWAEEQLQRDFDRPFLMAAGFFRPHLPHIAPKRYFDMYKPEDLWLPPTGPDDMEGMPPAARQVALAGYQDSATGTHRTLLEADKRREITQAYLATVSFVDDCIGRVLQALENSKYADNTIVVLASDNGSGLGEHFHWKKWSIFDNGSNIPFIIKAPGMGGMGNACEAGVDLTDIYPTLVDLCGLPDPGHLEGESLRALLSGEQTDRERPGITSFGPHNTSLRTSKYRYTRYADGGEELYDYTDDPWEHRNLADDPNMADVKADLAKWLPENPAPALASSPAPGGPIEMESGQMVWFRSYEDGFAGRRVTVRAKIDLKGDEGIIVHHGSYFSGYALYIRDRRLCMAVTEVPTPLRWDQLDTQTTIARSAAPLPDGEIEVEGVWNRDGAITLKADGQIVGTAQSGSGLSIYPTGRLDCGFHVVKETGNFPTQGDAPQCDAFPGTVNHVHVLFED